MFTKVNKQEYIDKRLLPFIANYHSIWKLFVLIKAHHSNIVQEHLTQKDIPFVSRIGNPPSVPQGRPIKTVWIVLERKIYENNWGTKDIDHLVKRIKQNARTMLQGMVEGVWKKFRAMWRDGLYSVL